jgi:dihydrofolate reductase
VTVKLSLVAAIGEKFELGHQDDLVWKISEDLKNFKRLTLGHTLLMGRKTFESIGRPLPGRETLVLSRSKELEIAGVTIVSSLEEAIEICLKKNCHELMVCGGGELYAQTISKADRLYISHIHAQASADTFFPQFDPQDWDIIERSDYPQVLAQPAWSFVHYQRRES